MEIQVIQLSKFKLTRGDANFIKQPIFYGRGYSITDGTDRFDYVEPNGMLASFPDPENPSGPRITNIPTKIINCKIYLHHGGTLSSAQFCEFKHYVLNNIKQVWDSNSNWGLLSTYDPDINPYDPLVPASPGIFTRNKIISSEGITIHEAKAKQFEALEDGEILLMTSRNPGRSNIQGNKRLGFLFYNRLPVAIARYIDANSQNTPAHEFGHALGLGDRYCYYGDVREGRPSDGYTHFTNGIGNSSSVPSFVAKRSTPTVLPTTPPTPPRNVVIPPSGSTAVFISENEDSEYSQRYQWVHNLMSSTSIVPELQYVNISQSDLVELEILFSIYNDLYRPTPALNPIFNDIESYDKITIFVSNNQWNYIEQHLKEERVRWITFRKQPELSEINLDNANTDHPAFISPDPRLERLANFNGSFAGVFDDDNDNDLEDYKVITDDKFRDSDREFDVTMLYFKLHISQMSGLHKMDNRKYQDYEATPPQLRKSDIGYYSPYKGDYSIPTTEPTPDFVLFPGQGFVEDPDVSNTSFFLNDSLNNPIAETLTGDVRIDNPATKRPYVTYFDLNTGGNVVSRIGKPGINKIRSIIFLLINKAFTLPLTTNSNTLVISDETRDVIQKFLVLNLTNDINSNKFSFDLDDDAFQAQELLINQSKFKKKPPFGTGNIIGRILWDVSISSDAAVKDPSLLGNNPRTEGNRPYSEASITVFPNSIPPTGWPSSGFASQNATIAYRYYYNRDNIIDIMGENI
jgi:hypothetical protein